MINLWLKNNKRIALSLIMVIAMSTSGCGEVSKILTKESQMKEELVQNLQQEDVHQIEVTKEGQVAYDWVKTIEEKWPIREAGTETEKTAANGLADVFKDLGLTVTQQTFEFKDDKGEARESQNVIGTLSPQLKKRILIGAHYDSVVVGKGSDDNGSGVAAVLTLAAYLKDKDLPYGFDFVLFGGEEVGIYGSEAYVAKLEEEKALMPILMINYDSLIAGDVPNVYVGKEKDAHLEQILELAKSNQLPLYTQNEGRSGLPYGMSIDASDHAPFKNKGIDILYFEGTNWSAGSGDGYTQTLDSRVPGGEIWHTENDQLSQIETYFGDRPLQRLSLFTKVTILFLEQFNE